MYFENKTKFVSLSKINALLITPFFKIPQSYEKDIEIKLLIQTKLHQQNFCPFE